MVQLNLLPDVKNEYIKSQRKKRLTILSAIVVSGSVLGIVLLMVSYVYIGQKLQLSSLNSNIKKNSAELQKINDLNKILTIQNQLDSLTGLHEQKPVTSRIFGYLPTVIPSDVQISSLNVNFAEESMDITGTTGSLGSVNKFVDTLKFTNLSIDQNTGEQRAFSKVVLTSFGVTNQQATFIIMLKFDPLIFSSQAKTVSLTVPKITSTRSQTEQPSPLFKELPTNTNTGEGSR
ncbi:MAG: hypothetical protein WCP03_03095 [Candidatus Saccharibacteria bacterium]